MAKNLIARLQGHAGSYLSYNGCGQFLEFENGAATSVHSAFDAAKAEAFAGRFLSALNSAALCLMASVGHRTGLFDVMSELPPATSEEIALQARLDERYVREWLGAMVTAGVIHIEPGATRFWLPLEHAAFLTRAAGSNNMSAYAQYTAVLGGVEDDIVECFRTGGGVPYERFPRFHEVMAEDSGLSVLSSLESHILPLVPELAERLANGIRVLDLGCGRGRIVNHLAELHPRSRFVGMDISSDAIKFARDEASGRRLHNVEFVAVDLSNFDETAEPEAFDFITTFDAVHDEKRGRPIAAATEQRGFERPAAKPRAPAPARTTTAPHEAGGPGP